QRNIPFNKVVIAGLAILFFLQVISFALIAHTQRNATAAKKASENVQLVYNEIDGNNQSFSLSVLPKENKLYLAELNLTIPFNQMTRSVRYYNEERNGNIRISSSLMTDHTVHTQSCYDMVRLKIEATPDAYSPSQPLYATVNLADGRNLQIYASTTKECQ